MRPSTEPAADLFDTTLEWSRQWWDPAAAMLWNPDGAFPALAGGRSLHQVPNTAWYAWALLATEDPDDERDALSAIEALLDLQYDDPDAVVHGTFRRFLEWPAEPPDVPVMWEDYDPNWRQFVGTCFALVLEDFGVRLGDDLGARVFAAVRRASDGEPDGRIPAGYSNPALMRAWLDAWVGRHTSDHGRFSRGERFAAEVIERFDRAGEFEEFNSPTYYGVDLYALALWRSKPPSPWFEAQGRRVEAAVWRSMLSFFHPELQNWAGPYTRCYHPDATRSVAKAALWMWAVLGRDRVPIPPLTSDVDHGHDLASGPVIARLAEAPAGLDLDELLRAPLPRRVVVTLPGDRRVEARLGAALMVGVESGDHEWGGWDQFFPFVAHWRTRDGSVSALWLARPHRVTAGFDREGWVQVENAGAGRLEFWVQGTSVAATASGLDVDGVTVEVDTPLSVEQAGADRWLVAAADGVVGCRVRWPGLRLDA